MDPKRVIRIAQWEVTKNAGGVDKRTILITIVSLVAMGIVAAVAASGAGAGLNADIYRVGVDESSPYYDVVESNAAFRVQEPDPEAFRQGKQDLTFDDGRLIGPPRTDKGKAALSELRSSTENYNDRVLGNEPNETAAFPVTVRLIYEQRGDSAEGTNTTDRDNTGGSPNSGSAGDESTSEDGTPADDGSNEDGDSDDGTAGTDTPASGETTPTSSDGTSDENGSSDRTSGEQQTVVLNGTAENTTLPRGEGDDGGAGGLAGLGAQLTGGQQSGTPSDISPPFPFESLLLAFLYIVPMNFVIQAYGSSMLSERLKRRGELLLVTPASQGDIIGGKTLPYLLGSLGVAAGITATLRFSGLAPAGSLVSLLAFLPIVLLFLAATFCGAMFARSFKELTFVTVTITVGLTSYAFVPAIFTDVTPIALISPLTIVVRDLTGAPISTRAFVGSTGPSMVAALVLFGLGAGLYREEDMFTQRSIPLKILDALSGRIKSRGSAFKMSITLMPFVIVAELAAVAFFFVLDSISLNVFGTVQSLGIILIFITIAFIEELAKSLHIYAGYANERYERGLRTSVWLGALSGIGFFVAEKGLVIARATNLQSLDIGNAALQGATLPSGVPLWAVAILFLLGPLLLHMVTAAISAVGARRGTRSYVLAFGGAVCVHFLYNIVVVTSLA
jgi:ABC-type Na+ efflux pump permease subunit